jgi:hypothetical protein
MTSSCSQGGGRAVGKAPNEPSKFLALFIYLALPGRLAVAAYATPPSSITLKPIRSPRTRIGSRKSP